MRRHGFLGKQEKERNKKPTEIKDHFVTLIKIGDVNIQSYNVTTRDGQNVLVIITTRERQEHAGPMGICTRGFLKNFSRRV